MRRSCFVAAVVVLGLIAPVPSGAVEVKPRRGGTPVARFNDALMRGDASLEELLRLRRDMLVSSPLQGGSGLFAPALRDDHPCEDVEPAGEAVMVTPVLAGDLDGVPGDEAVTLATPYSPACRVRLSFFLLDRPESITVRSGADATPRWTVQTNNLQYLQRADLTGDGIDDLITYEESITQLYSGVVRTRIRGRSGVDGSLLWERRYTATIEFAWAGFVSVVGVTNLVTGVSPMDDVDGDRVGELLVTRITTKLAVAFLVINGVSRVVAESVSGEWGGGTAKAEVTSSFSCVAVCTGGVASVVAAGDVDADGRADLFAVYSRSALWFIEAMSAYGERIWRTSVRTLVALNGVAADLTGDGVDDLVLATYAPLAAVDGGKGTLLWSGPRVLGLTSIIDGNGLMITRDLDGDGGRDFVVETSGRTQVVLLALSGANAAELWRHEVDPSYTPTPQQWTSFGVLCGPSQLCPGVDTTGDGIDDLVVRAELLEDDGLGPAVVRDSRLYVVDGRSGIVALDVTDHARGRHIAADVDGDGATDVLGLYEDGRFRPRFFSGRDLTPLATITYPEGSDNVGDVIVGDLFAEAGSEVMLSVLVPMPDDWSRVQADALSVSGLRWRV